MKKIRPSLILIFLGILFLIGNHELISAHTSESTDSPIPKRLLMEKQAQKYVPGEIIVKFRETRAKSLDNQLKLKTSARKIRLSAELDTLNAAFGLRQIKPVFKNFRRDQKKLAQIKQKDESLLSKTQKRILRRLKRVSENVTVPELERIYKLKFEPGPQQSLEELVGSYRNNPDVEYAELNYIVSADKTPNDPLYHYQWPLHNTGQYYPRTCGCLNRHGNTDCDIDAPQAWDITTSKSDVVVAVVDTGVDNTHRDLQSKMWADANGAFGYDFVNDDNDPADDYGHGTHCAGIIAAATDNGLDVAGVCWNAKIMSVKFLDTYGYGTTEGAVSSIYYAVENGADVISNSWGGGDYSETLEEAVNYAYSMGVVLVAAAGNVDSNEPHYPAYYDNMIAVAATDSNDRKASFSTYGDWVDIAAPGVDILSLVPAAVPSGTQFDDYTKVRSGTSMACPHVAGACALLLSVNPELGPEEIREILINSVDPIEPGICLSNGRLNIFNAVYSAIPSKGFIDFEDDFYSCEGLISVLLADRDLKGQSTQQVTVTTISNDFETVMLDERIETPGVFAGVIESTAGGAILSNGTVELVHNDIIAGVYYDADDGTQNPAIATDSAVADCVPPIIFNVEIFPFGPEPTVTFETDELTTARIFCGTDCSNTNDITATDFALSKSHSIKLAGVSTYTQYFFIIEANDVVTNKTVDSNSGGCYSFTTNGPEQIYVPLDYETIQEAIDVSWDTGTVWVADGNHTGDGNRDIDFKARAITLKSVNGPNNCVIDVQGTVYDSHRGFYFHNEEGNDSVVDGFTITNADCNKACSNYWPGGGFYCVNSSPTIANCIIKDNIANNSGGGIYCNNSSPVIQNCIFNNNQSYISGGAIACDISSPVITNCMIINNHTFKAGHSAIYYWYGNLLLKNSVISYNPVSMGNYAGIHCYGGDNKIENCTIVQNSAAYFGQQINAENCSLEILNSIIGSEQNNVIFSINSNLSISYSNISNGIEGILDITSQINWGPGNIDVDPCFVSPGFFVNRYDPNITVAEDDPNAFWLEGDMHLKSNDWRWDKSTGQWIYDTVTSRCIDAGNPASSLADEPLSVPVDPTNNRGQNLRINIGAYGGTAEASIAGYDWAILADINNDGLVNLDDYAFFARHWFSTEQTVPGNLNRDSIIDQSDLEYIADDWLKTTIWK